MIVSRKKRGIKNRNFLNGSFFFSTFLNDVVSHDKRFQQQDQYASRKIGKTSLQCKTKRQSGRTKHSYHRSGRDTKETKDHQDQNKITCHFDDRIQELANTLIHIVTRQHFFEQAANPTDHANTDHIYQHCSDHG